MCFVTIEDGTGLVEATLFPKVYQRFGGLLHGRGPFVFVGLVEERVGGGLDHRLLDDLLGGGLRVDGLARLLVERLRIGGGGGRHRESGNAVFGLWSGGDAMR